MKVRFSPAKLGLISILSAAAITFAPPVFAKPPFFNFFPPSTPTPTVTPTPTPQPPGFVPPQPVLTGGRLEACRAHERVIQIRMNNLLRFTKNMLETFDRISMRAQEFYKFKVLAAGRTVANYDLLISDIQVKQATVQTDLNTAKNDANNFICNGVDPKGNLTQFRVDMQEVKRALKDYRTAIKNLIVAVRGVAAELPKPTPTPK